MVTSLTLQSIVCMCCVPSMANFSTASLAFSEENYGNDSGLAVYVAKSIDPTLCWDDITWLKKNTSLPVVVKGILNGTHTHTNAYAHTLSICLH